MSRLFKSDETSSEPKMMANYQHQLFYHLNQCAQFTEVTLKCSKGFFFKKKKIS